MSRVALLAVVLAVAGAASAAPAPQDLAFLLRSDEIACTAFYWRPVPGQPQDAYFLSAGHCWQATYVEPPGATVLWAESAGIQPTLVDILIGQAPDARTERAYPPDLKSAPKIGDAHEVLLARFERGPRDVRFERVTATLRASFGRDSLVYDAARCVGPAYSGSPVLTDEGRLVGVAVLGSSQDCKRLYVFPITALYALRPDLRP